MKSGAGRQQASMSQLTILRCGVLAAPTTTVQLFRRKVVALLLLPLGLVMGMATLVRQFYTFGSFFVVPRNAAKNDDEKIRIVTRTRGGGDDDDSAWSTGSLLVVASIQPSSKDGIVCHRPTSTSNRDDNDPSLKDADADCLRQVADTMARVWTPRPKSSWCGPAASQQQQGQDDNNATTRRHAGSPGGIVLVKVPKSASSTMAGMTMHAAAHSDQIEGINSTSSTRVGTTRCPVEWEHAHASDSPTVQRLAASQSAKPSDDNRRNVLLLAPIRDPFQRALSDVYYHYVSLGSGHKKSPQDGFVIRQLDRIPTNFALRYVSISAWNESDTSERGVATFDDPHEPFRIPSTLVERVRDAVHAYDFWVVVDRFVESMVALANLTGVSYHEYMTMPSKVGGSYYRSSPTSCVQLVPPKSTPRILQHARTHWNRRNAGDWLLYHVANASLDMTIDAIGREWVAQKVRDVRAFQEHIQVACANETHFPCSATGHVQAQLSRESCYARDFGCGHACVRRESQLWQVKSPTHLS